MPRKPPAKKPVKKPTKPISKLHPAEQYARDVIDGKILANRWVTMACQRYFDDIRDAKEKGFVLDREEGDRIIKFHSTFLRFYEGDFDGRPFILEPWQQFISWNLFSWKLRDGFRRFRTAFIEASKGNGKSPMAAATGLYGLTMDHEPGAECYAAATTKEQAGILFRDAKSFTEHSPSLSKRLVVDKHNISYPDTNSFFRPISSEHRGLDGKRPHMALIDEIHEHPNSLVVDKMRAGTKSRRNGMIYEITNSGYDRQSICYQHHEYSEKILQRVIDNESWFAYMTGLDPCQECLDKGATAPTEGCPNCDDWRDDKVWIKSNPNLGISVPYKYLQEQVNEALNLPAKQNIVKRLNFSVWTQSLTKWLSVDKWNACNAPVDVALLHGRRCYGGLDLSSNIDTTALVWVFPPDSGDTTYSVLCRFFIPKDNMLARVKRDRVPYDVWVREGYITATPGNIIDYGFILKQIGDDCLAFDVRELAFDRWGSQKITTDLQELGFEVKSDSSKAESTDRTLIQFGQGYASLSAPSKELEKMIINGEIAHGGNPVLAWMASNVVIESDAAGNVKPSKEKSTERIDGILGVVMGLSRALINTDDESIYEREGLMII
jgi:phage terminase large subunit-like protein